MSVQGCPIHSCWGDPENGPSPNDIPVSAEQEQAWMLEEFIAHHSPKHGDLDGYCSYCYEEWQIKTMGIEGYTAMCLYYEAEAREMCTCS